MRGDSLQILYFSIFIISLAGLLFLFHFVRMRLYGGPFVMFVSLLWVFAYITGILGYKADVSIFDYFTLHIRYSSSIYALIFVGLLLAYVCEGTREGRNLILVSLGSQIVIGLSQPFLFNLAGISLTGDQAKAAEILFKPSARPFAVSIFAAIVDLFFAVTFFQFMVNRLSRKALALPLFVSLVATMALDSVIFLGLNYPDVFLQKLPSHLIFKTIIVSVLSVPLALYLRYLKGHMHLNLNRGSLDIFRTIENLEKDLEKANKELRAYADNLEVMVEERTHEIKQKQELLDLELEMAAEVQKSMLPDSERLPGINFAVSYLPCSSVSGDLYDFGKFTDDEYFFFIADISGHGVPSALVGAMCKMSLSRINLRSTSPGNVLSVISRTIQPVTGNHYLTAIFVTVSKKDRELVYANGAHVTPLLLSPSSQCVTLEPTGSIIGTELVSNSFTQKRIRYPAGSRLVLYTDCVTEHRNTDRVEFGLDRFRQIMLDSLNRTPQEALDTVLQSLRAYDATEFSDDLTLLIVDLP